MLASQPEGESWHRDPVRFNHPLYLPTESTFYSHPGLDAIRNEDPTSFEFHSRQPPRHHRCTFSDNFPESGKAWELAERTPIFHTWAALMGLKWWVFKTTGVLFRLVWLDLDSGSSGLDRFPKLFTRKTPHLFRQKNKRPCSATCA